MDRASMSTGAPARAPRVALVLGAGGIKCVAAVGLFRVLVRAGIPIDMVVGSSGGSIFASCYALYPDDLTTMERFLWTYWRKEAFRDFDVAGLARAAIVRRNFRGEQFGIIRGEKIYRNFQEMFPGKAFSDTTIPLRIVATNLIDGQPVVLSSGEIALAVRASVAMPVYIRPVALDGRLLADGGMSDPLPIAAAVAEGADLVISLGFEAPLEEVPDSPVKIVANIIRLSRNNLLRAIDDRHELDGSHSVRIYPDFNGNHRFFNFERFSEIIELGEQAAESRLGEIRRHLAECCAPNAAP